MTLVLLSFDALQCPGQQESIIRRADGPTPRLHHLQAFLLQDPTHNAVPGPASTPQVRKGCCI